MFSSCCMCANKKTLKKKETVDTILRCENTDHEGRNYITTEANANSELSPNIEVSLSTTNHDPGISTKIDTAATTTNNDNKVIQAELQIDEISMVKGQEALKNNKSIHSNAPSEKDIEDNKTSFTQCGKDNAVNVLTSSGIAKSSNGNNEDTDNLQRSDENDSFNINKDNIIDNGTAIRKQPSIRESCLSRRGSSKSSLKKKVNYKDTDTVIPSPEYLNNNWTDDDEVFSDLVPPKLPRGDMCTPYLKKRGSIPGLVALPDWFAEDREDGGIMEPPTTPIGRDELALRRHRFFADLLTAAQAAAEHRVRFDPFPSVVNDDCDPDTSTRLNSAKAAAELESLITRLEKLVDRLERSVSARELERTNHLFDQSLNLNSLNTDLYDLPTVLPDFETNLEQRINNIELINNKLEEDLKTIPTVVSQLAFHNSFSDQLENTMSVQAFEDIVNGPLAQFLTLSNKVGGDVATQAEFVRKAFDAQIKYLILASQSAAPAAADVPNLLKPTSDEINNIQVFREKNRTSKLFNHLSAISESIPALGWVCVTPTPGPHVKEMNDAGQFYTNRVLKDWKEKDNTHVEWARSWVQTLTELQAYIKQYHTTGLVWSGKGKAAAGGGAPPPPPPGGLPPPPPVLNLADLAIDNSNDDRNALFAQINKGADITKGLKKVTADMQTHKNPSIRTGPAPYKAPQPFVSSSAANNTAAPMSTQVIKAPVFTREGKKWLIEYQKDNSQMVVENAEMNNVVYMFKCINSTVVVKGKINGVILDSCKKCSIVFDSLVSSVEFVNCQSVQMQVLGKVPTITIDKTDGCQMYLSSDSLDVEIVSSKSSEMNVMIPKGNGDYTEQPIPEQFKTFIKNNALSTICVESLG